MKQFTPETFYRNIDYLAKRDHMSLRDVSRIAGMTDSYLSVMKNQGSTPTLNVVIAICEVFSVKMEDLLFTDFGRLEMEIAEKEAELAMLRERLRKPIE